MTAGASGTYAVNGTDITLPPTSGRWMPRESLGIDGNGRAIYPGVREFELRWQLISPSDYNQLQTFFSSIGNTGTVVVDLPQYGAASYLFYSYTGCVLREPETGQYFTENQLSAFLLVTNIRTT